MDLLKSLKIIFVGTALIIYIGGCSSSSYNDRYNKPKTEEKEKSGNARFTSKDDPQHESSQDTAVYNNFNADEFDEKPVEEYPVDNSEFIKKYEKFSGLGIPLTNRERVIFEIVKFLDTPYQYGGSSEEGIDCSAFIQQVFSNTLGINLPRTASQQFTAGTKLSKGMELKFGDLIFFDTTSRSFPGHVGIYLGEDQFAHASRSQGVIVSSLKSSYYAARYVGGRRIAVKF